MLNRRMHTCRAVLMTAFVLARLAGGGVEAQDLLDRVLARVQGQPITLSDTRVAIALGLTDVSGSGDRTQAALQGLIDRQLLLTEVARFSPPEPDPRAHQAEVAALRSRAGAQLAALMSDTGLDDARLEELARDNLRIQAYLNGRFGGSVQALEDEAAAYYRTHEREFMRDGVLIPFEEAEPVARQRAAAERRAAAIAQWLKDLRGRADIRILK